MELADKVIDGLYLEAMILADESRGYFEGESRSARSLLDPAQRVTLSCESLKVTTRLMHIIAWLLSRRSGTDAGTSPMLGEAAATTPEALHSLPEPARLLIAASEDLYDRVARLDRQYRAPLPTTSAARSLMSRLERAF